LRARGLQTGETFAASVVTLLVQAERYSVLWAGNARAYLLRDGQLRLLTRDHVEPRLPTLLTRAIGGAAQLSLDSAIGQARANDIFLLCSAGLTTTLSEQEIAETLANVVSARQAALHLTQDSLIAGATLDVSALAVVLSTGSVATVN
jgi:type VI secretion system protein ImpM